MIRVAAGIALALLVGGAFTFNALGAPIDPNSHPLRFGHAFGGDDPRLLVVRESPVSQTTPRLQEYDYAYAPGAEIRIAFTLSNGSGVPLTVSEVDANTSSGIGSIEFRLPPRLSSDLPPTYPNEYPDQQPDAWASQQFHSFEIPAQGEVGLAVAVTLQCPGASPAATLPPGASPLPASDPALTGGYDVLSVIEVRYAQLGIARTDLIALPFVMHVITSAKNVNGCPSA